MKIATTKFSQLSATVFGVMFVSSIATAGVVGSKHDMSAKDGASTTSVCVFCHTPHGSDTSAAVPLWNKALPSTTYTRYSSLGTATLDGSESAVGSVSLACLSCHDGTQAMDSVINAPGSGNYNAAGDVMTGSTIGAMTGAPVPMLGDDLSNDHPISIEYAGGACDGTSADCDPSSATSGDPDFAVAQFASINSQPNWWVDVTGVGGSPNVRDKTDMILYTRGTGPSVECGSCHDPHNDTSTSGGQALSFLRVDNTASKICVSCHNK